ncbi:MAG: hypothetical protein AAF561_09685 [Planctomycetota bacterium]
MSRLRTETINVKPTNNIYTVLTGVAALVCVIVIVLLYGFMWPNVTDDVPLFIFL